MFTPIGYFAPQGAGGFDPTLGGTLTVNHWYDFTDSTTMTLSAGRVTAINDKVGSYNVTNAYNGGPTFIDAATGTYFNGETLYETSTVPTSMGNSNATYLTICTRTAPFTDLMRVWGFESSWSTFDHGRADFQPMVLSNFGLWPRTESDSGQGGSDYMWAHDWDVNDYASGFYNVDSTNEQFFSVASEWFSRTNFFYTSEDGSSYGNTKGGGHYYIGSDYFEFGARGSSNGLHQNRFYGNLKHCIVYDGILSNTNISDLYTAWQAI